MGMSEKEKRNALLTFLRALFKKQSNTRIETNIEHLLLRIEKITGKQFKNHLLVKRALTHKSSRIADEQNNYERMEFLGDAVLGLVISDLLYTTYKNEDEGKLTYYKDTLIQMKSLASKARKLGLGNYVIVGNKERKNGFLNSDVLLGDIFESLVGAIYLDMGFEAVFKFISTLFKKDIVFVKEQPEWDFKSKLNNLAQELYKNPPEYKVIDEPVINGTKLYRVIVEVNNKTIAQGQGRSKKEAEQEAAMKALKVLSEIQK
jgi:ribonuclease-3